LQNEGNSVGLADTGTHITEESPKLSEEHKLDVEKDYESAKKDQHLTSNKYNQWIASEQ